MLVLIRGAGDLATGIALRLHRAGMRVAMTDLPRPTAIRRTVAFSQAIVLGQTVVSLPDWPTYPLSPLFWLREKFLFYRTRNAPAGRV